MVTWDLLLCQNIGLPSFIIYKEWVSNRIGISSDSFTSYITKEV